MELDNLPDRARRLRGNEPHVLDEPGDAWLVEDGSLAVFAVSLRTGRPDGPRRYCFGCEAGDVLFGFPTLEQERGAQVVAVALEATRLRRVEGASAAEAPPGGIASAYRSWSERWQRCLETGPRTVAPREAGAADAAGGRERTQTELLAALAALLVREAESERERLSQRHQRAGEATRQAVGELTSVLEPDQAPLPRGSDLFVAAFAAAREQGITLRAPAAWQAGVGVTDPIELIARSSHVRARRVVLREGWWQEDAGPLLGFTADGKRPLALLPRPGGYRVLDPASGEQRRVDDATAATLDAEAWVFYRPLPERIGGGIELLRFALRGRSRDVVAIGSTGAAATLLGMFTPQATALLVDHAIPDGDRAMVWQLGFGLLAAAFGAAVFRLAQGVATLRLETGADAATQAAVWDRLLNLRLSFFRGYSIGDLQSRVTAIGQMRGYLGGTTLRTMFSSIILLLNLGLLLYYSPALTLIALGAAAVSGSVAIVSGWLILRRTRQILELRGRFFGLMVQLIQGVSKLRVAAAETRAFARWSRDYARLLRLELGQRAIRDRLIVVNVAVAAVSAVALFAVAASLIRTSGAGLTTGVFLAFNVAYGTFVAAVVSLSNTVTDLMTIAILRERARPILDAIPEVNERKADPGQLSGLLEVDKVTFQYLDDGPLVLDGVSLRAAPGEFVALVGPSGGGKSTLFRLLLGFETPRDGGVYLDGQDLSGLDVHAVRRQMGVVLQNGRINAGSIHENIVTGTRLSLEDAWEAARATGFADEIEQMPMGMHTVISEGGTNLSGGQRQRLLLTRALVHRPRILLLDEATSALDNRSQEKVSESLRRLDVTRVVIAHRLSTVQGADRVYVIDAGRVVEQGTAAELARAGGLFERLMRRQMT